MKNNVIRKIMCVLAVVNLVVMAVLMSFLPEKMPMHYDLNGVVDRWGSKYENFIFPIIIIVMGIFWIAFSMYFERKATRSTEDKEIKSLLANAKVLDIVGLCETIFFIFMEAFGLYKAINLINTDAVTMSVDSIKIEIIGTGVLIIVLANFMTRTKMNKIVGIRTSFSMYNDRTWRKSNRFGAYALMISGLLTIVTAVFIRQSIVGVFLMLAYILVAVIATMIYSKKVYDEERTINVK
ncbi:SdpI family protein [Lachnospira multipara]|uniref:SdpI family protein n=1 Tax=Lachnospira multipara TaxID=28051 RepID=UPI00068BB8A1|nr:SdpI family protein [Lachnospira multipara]